MPANSRSSIDFRGVDFCDVRHEEPPGSSFTRSRFLIDRCRSQRLALAIGPGMDVLSRCVRVLETDGSPLGVCTALCLINQSFDELLAEQEGEFDADTLTPMHAKPEARFRNTSPPFEWIRADARFAPCFFRSSGISIVLKTYTYF